MALPTTGPISLGDIQSTFGGSNPISLGEYYGYAEGVATSGAISVQEFRGKANLIQYLIVAGGGGADNRHGGGGGAGGYIQVEYEETPGASYSAVIGAGGTGSESGSTSGSNTTFRSLTAIGGGLGEHGERSLPTGAKNGGSGGGGSATTGPGNGEQPDQSGDSGTYGFGNDGGNYSASSQIWGIGGGGGGAGAVGGDATSTTCGDGGAGKEWLDGNFYAGGGAGGGRSGNTPGSGGVGGGGDTRTSNDGSEGDGLVNTGGGGGGGDDTVTRGGNGGSGVVIARYYGVERGTGGTVTQSGGYTYHKFTSSGTFTI
jgi:hypothetical protein